jgi:hypothetical protein
MVCNKQPNFLAAWKSLQGLYCIWCILSKYTGRLAVNSLYLRTKKQQQKKLKCYLIYFSKIFSFDEEFGEEIFKS